VQGTAVASYQFQVTSGADRIGKAGPET